MTNTSRKRAATPGEDNDIEATTEPVIVPPNPWDEQDARTLKESEGALFTWENGWTLTLRRISNWNKHWAEASARLGRRPDVKAFLARTSPKDYKFTDADQKFWRRVETEQFAEGCVANWHVTGRDGAPLAMTPKNLLDVLTRFPDFLSEARAWAAAKENFAPELETGEEGKALGNS